MANPIANETRASAERSGGASDVAIYTMVERAINARGVKGEVAIDLGCGSGRLHDFLTGIFSRYIGVDAARYANFPAEGEFMEADLNAIPFPIGSATADAVFALETIEHLENPRALLREMVRIAKPNGWIVVTTPNQLSVLSLGTLGLKKRFSAFQDVHYPAHITALLESDLLRIANELQLIDPRIEYSRSGRIVFTPFHYPRLISNIAPRLGSDNLLLIARVP